MRLSVSIEINKPPKEVFPWVENPQRAMQWQTGVSGGEIIQQTPNWVGTTFTETIEEDGRSTEMRGMVTDYVANRRMAFHLEGDYNIVDVVFTAEGDEKITRFSQVATVRFKGLLKIIYWILGPLFRRKMQLQMQSELARLKELCEQN